MMDAYLLSQLAFATGVLGMLAAAILVFGNSASLFSNKLLAGAVFSAAFLMGHLSLVHSGIILRLPHLYRLPLPFTYLIAPLSYLYVRTLLKKEARLRRSDWIHFLPFILHALELMPFYRAQLRFVPVNDFIPTSFS